MSGVGRAPRVLVVAYDFPPHAAIGTMRTLRVVRQLHARGWAVSVLTGAPGKYLPGTPVDPALLEQVPAGVRVIRAGAVRPWLGFQDLVRGSRGGAGGAGPSGRRDRQAGVAGTAARGALVQRLIRVKDIVDAALAIPDRESGWLVPAISTGVVNQIGAAKPDIIYSSAPPWTGQLVAAALQVALRRPWVADFRDPWARAPWRGDRYAFALRAAGALERFVIRRANRVIFVAGANRDDFAAHYGAAASKFVVVPNGCDPTEFDRLRDLPAPADKPHVMLHAGSLYAGRTPVPLFKALAVAIARGGIDPAAFRLRFLGANALKGVDLPRVCQELGLEGVVEFLPRVPREQGLRAMVSASSLLLLQPGHSVSVPGKVYEYLASGRPIFAIAEEGETSEIVRASGAGVAVRPDDVGAIASALERLIEGRDAPAVPRRFFDGNLGASEIADVLATELQRSWPHASRPGTTPSLPAPVTARVAERSSVERT